MNSRPIIGIGVLAIASLMLAYPAEEMPQRTLNDTGPIAQEVYRDGAEIRALELDVQRLQQRESQQDDTIAGRGERISRLEQEVATHDRMIWGTITGLGIPMFLLLFEAAFRLSRPIKKAH